MQFVSGCFQDFFFVLVFSSMVMMCLHMDFFEVFLLGVCWASWICRFMSFTKLRRFSAIISLTIFSASHFFPFFLNCFPFLLALLLLCFWVLKFPLVLLYIFSLLRFSTLYSCRECSQLLAGIFLYVLKCLSDNQCHLGVGIRWLFFPSELRFSWFFVYCVILDYILDIWILCYDTGF